MKDMTHGSIRAHLIALAAPIAFGMLFQTLYVLVDLYFVAGLGDEAIAGVGSAGNASFLILALTQVLGIGSVALIAQAVGRKDRAGATLVFNQSLLLSLLGVAGSLLFGYALAPLYVAGIGSDAATRAAGLCPTCIGTCRGSRCNSPWWAWGRRCAAAVSRGRPR
jgi:Na+-driven multidrug efflux pump